MSANGMLDSTIKNIRPGIGDDGAPITSADVLVRTAICFSALIVAAVPGWVYVAGSMSLYLLLIIGVLALGFWVAARTPVGAGLALGYSVVLGAMAGAFSHLVALKVQDNGIVFQALLGTGVGIIAVFAVYSTPWGRNLAKSWRMFTIIAFAYLGIGIANVFAAVAGIGGGWGFYGVGAFGVALCLAGVALACWSLLVSIEDANQAIAAGISEKYSWSLGVAVMASIVWLYLEILRLLGVVRK